LRGNGAGSGSRRRCAVTLRQSFGANVRHYRKARDMNQRELADAVDLSLAMVGKIERGNVAPSFESIEKIARVLEVPEAILFSAGTMTVPTGERGRLLQRINIQLSKLNNNELSRAAKMLTALTD
jgi:transcriptional regulator with XRE-family HTH domain